MPMTGSTRVDQVDSGWVRALPKAELHVHVEGAARAATVADLARLHGIDLGVADPADLYRYGDLADFLRVFDLVCCVLRTADDIRRVTYESLEIAHSAGVRYREMFFSPMFLLRKGVSFPTIWDGLTAGVSDAETDFGVRCRLIMDVDKPSGPAAAMELLELAEDCDPEILIGIGGDAGERGFDLAAFAEPFAAARARGWRTTMHLGEEGPVADIRIGVDVLGVDRIDHGVSLIDDAALTAEVAGRRLPVTCCPTSNVCIGIVDAIANHPIAAMRAAGVLVTVNSDNAEMFGVDMADEMSNVSTAFGWQLAALEDLCLAGVEGSWMSDTGKDAMIAEFTSKMDALRAGNGTATRFAPPHRPTAEEL
jgi:adenosine deaminase